ncbi:MAG: low affinity iron permease family protein [Proteobacteria bacterium]|nr:low affinity iron permease family protein [Pseudomonadota bacterium]
MDRVFSHLANAVARATGRPATFLLCCLLVIVWALTGPAFRFSDTWQLVINTGTTIVTFLMVFLIQNTQNREGAALQAKLDELIRAVENAQNRYIGLEKRDEEDIEQLKVECETEAMAEGDLEPTGHGTTTRALVG